MSFCRNDMGADWWLPEMCTMTHIGILPKRLPGCSHGSWRLRKGGSYISVERGRAVLKMDIGVPSSSCIAVLSEVPL